MSIKKRLAAALLAAVCALSFTACSGQSDDKNNKNESKSSTLSDDESSDSRSVSEKLSDVLKEYNFSGCAYISKGGQELLSTGRGYADAKGTKEIDQNTVFYIGDISKSFTAGAVMLLIEQGKLSITDRLEKFFPDCAYGKNVILHQLLCMRSGIKDYLGYTDKDGTYHFYTSDELPVSISEKAGADENKKAIEKFILESELSFEPDSKTENSNSNYFLLARIVEKVSGMSFEDFVSKNFLEPLKMTRTGFSDSFSGETAEDLKSDESMKHLFRSGATFGCADMVSCASDLVLWEGSLIEGTILSKETVADMYYEHSKNPNGTYYGYGLMTDGTGSVFFYSGGISSFSSMIYADTFTDTRMVLLSNDPDVSIASVGTGLVKTLPEDALPEGSE